jgi:hypothetical protein
MTKEANAGVAEWTPDEQLINRAGAELQLMLETSPYRPDECLRRVMLPVIEKVRAGVKAAGLEVPKLPDVRSFSAESDGGKCSIDFEMTDEGSLEVDIYGREDRAVFYMSPEDTAKLRAWLK